MSNVAQSKLTYIANQARVRFEFTRQFVLENPGEVDKVIERARSKMMKEVSSGRIVFYSVYATRLKTMWKMLADSNEAANTRVAVTVCAGAPRLKGLIVEAKETTASLGTLTIAAPASIVNQWQPYFLKMTVGKILRDKGITAVANPAQLHHIWLEACQGKAINNVLIERCPQAGKNQVNDQPFVIAESTNNATLSLIINDVKAAHSQSVWRQIAQQIDTHVKTAEARGIHYEVLKADMIRIIRSALRGPERYGLDLPFVILAAYRRSALASATLDKKTASLPLKSVDKSSAPTLNLPPLKLKVASDHLLAEISSYKPPAGLKIEEKTLQLWIESNLRKQGIIKGIDPAAVTLIAQDILRGKTIDGVVIARGMTATIGDMPFVQRIQPNGGKSDQPVDFRKRRQIPFARKGETIAEIAYKDPSVDGFTVYGKTIAPVQERFEVVLSEGVERVENRFIAKIDGIIEVGDSHITITPGIVHSGNIDLTTGNLEFEGDVVVQGNIESGTWVSVKGNLTVNGSILGGTIQVTGDVTVEEGIAAVASRCMSVGKNLTAGFINNSHVIVAGNITVKKSIIASLIQAKGAITIVEAAGSIVGGCVCSEEQIQCSSVGRAESAATEIRLGTDAINQQTLESKQRRHDKLETLLNETNKKQSTVNQRNQTFAVQSKRNQSLGNTIEDRQKRLRGLVEKTKKQIEALKGRIKHNKKAKLLVSSTLYPNVTVHIAHRKYSNRDAVSAVMIQMIGSSVRAESMAASKASKAS
jgi:uncharacterized protein